jgi:HEAT repeat protein
MLIEVLKDDDVKVRARAAEAIGRLGPDGRDATEALFQLFKSEKDWQAALEAARAIQVTSVPNLIGILESKEPSLRSFGCERLRLIGPEAKEALPALQKLLEGEKEDFIKRQARGAIRKIEKE